MNPFVLVALGAKYLPAVGLLGLALYQAANQHDLATAGATVAQAAAILGITLGVHAKAPTK